MRLGTYRPGSVAQKSESVEADDDGGSLMAGHREGQRQMADEIPHHEHCDEGGCDDQVRHDQAASSASQGDDGRDRRQAVPSNDRVGSVERQVGTCMAHGYSDGGGGHGWGIVDTITDARRQGTFDTVGEAGGSPVFSADRASVSRRHRADIREPCDVENLSIRAIPGRLPRGELP